MKTCEDISRVQLDILTCLSRFERNLGLPQTEIEGFVNEGRAIGNNQRIIARRVNATSRNILSSGLIYRTVNKLEAQEILKAITVKIQALRSLLILPDDDISLLQPAGEYTMSHLHTNLQIASLHLEGLEEHIDFLVTTTIFPESTGIIGQQHPPWSQTTRSEDNVVDDDDDYDYKLSSRDVDFSEYWNSD